MAGTSGERKFLATEGKESVTGEKPPTNYFESLMHLLKGFIGSGIFAMGDAFRNSGLMVGVPVTIFLAFLNLVCQHQLTTACKFVADKQPVKVKPTYAETVENCFAMGPPSVQKYSNCMKLLTNSFLCITQLGFCCVYFVFVAESISQVMMAYKYNWNIHIIIAITLVPIWLTCLIGSLKVLAPLSMVANLFILVGLGITFYYIVIELPSITEREYVGELKNFPLYFGTVLFAFEGIGLVLPVQNEMEKPENFVKCYGVLNVGMTIITITHVAVGFMGYLRYGENIKGSITLNIPGEEILAQVVVIMIAIAITLTYALQMYIPFEILFPMFHDRCGPFTYPRSIEVFFKSLLILLTFVLAEAIPFLGLFISLVGASCSSALALLIPPVLEMISADNKIGAWMIIKNTIIIIIGIVGAITGTVLSIYQIVLAFMNKKEE